MSELYPFFKNRFVLRVGIMCFIFFISGISAKAQTNTASQDLEEFNVTISFDELGSYIFPAFYEDPDGLYIPVDPLLNLLKIVKTVSPDGQILKGYSETEDNSYEINFPEKFARFRDKKVDFSDKEGFMDMGTLYLRKNVLEKAFGFKIEFDFRSLSAKFTSEFELPAVKYMKLEKLRERLGGKEKEEAEFDTVMHRDYHWFKGSMLDWSVASTQTADYTGETRMELGYGAEVLGGETNVYLNWSNEYGMKREQQQYSWRWANNNSGIVRQMQLGRVSGRSIATLLSPVDGFTFTNAPTTVRKALGSYRVSDYTEPNWVVELYINNSLIAYTKADASGFFTFNIPIVYGTTNITLRFYGPGGEMRSEERKFNMPYNMLPGGEFEYRVTGGVLLDSIGSKFGKAQMDFGIARWLTVGGGVEYLSSIAGNPEIPFADFTFQPFPSMLIIGEYAYKVRTKGTMNLTLPGSSSLEVNYARYNPDQKAIIYNYLEERAASLSIPYRIRSFGGYTRFQVRQNIYPSFSYNSGEAMVSANYRGYSMSMSNFVNWTGKSSSNIYSNIAFGMKIGRNVNVRPSAQYNFSTGELISLRAELESKIFRNGHISLRCENGMKSGYNNVGLTFRYDFPFMSAYVSPSISNKEFQSSESAQGSFAFGSGNKYVHADKRNAVGRSGIVIRPFVDINFNGKQDKGEPMAANLKVHCSGGQSLDVKNDTLVRIIGLEPFVDYTITLDESGFESLTWRLPFKNIKVTTDPDQFKEILVPVMPMGEISGMISDESGNGIGRVLITFTDTKGKVVAKTLSESDGYFTYLGMKPGKYSVGVDSLQLSILKKEVDPVMVTVHQNVMGDVIDAGNLVWRSIPGTEKKPAEGSANEPASNEVTGANKINGRKAGQMEAGLKVAKKIKLSKALVILCYDNKTYGLQLGAFRNKKGAIYVTNKSRKLFGGNVSIVEEGHLHKVRTKPYQTYDEALRMAHKVQSVLHFDYIMLGK